MKVLEESNKAIDKVFGKSKMSIHTSRAAICNVVQIVLDEYKKEQRAKLSEYLETQLHNHDKEIFKNVLA